MIRFILRRRTADHNENLDRSVLFTVDGDTKEVERLLRSGGRGPMGFDFCELAGVEVLDDKPKEGA